MKITTIFFLHFVNKIFANYDTLYLATKNMSIENFDASTKTVKTTQSRLLIHHQQTSCFNLQHYNVTLRLKIKSPFPKQFSLFTKIYRKGQLHCAHLCSGKFQSNGDCNAFSYDSKSQVCKLANLTFLEDPKPENSAQVKFKSQKAFKMYLVLTVELHAQHSAL